MHATVERFYLQYGHRANAYSVAFDRDLERFVSPRGVVAVARCRAPLQTAIVYFDPLCDPADLPELLDEFILAEPSRHIGFWKVSQETAALLTARGFRVAGYGTEHDVDVPTPLAGSVMRGLRREIGRARRAGITVTRMVPSVDTWGEVESVDKRWLTSRVRRFQIRRVTRRYERGCVEPHTTKLCARRASDNALVGWACLDHIYQRGELVGVGLSGVRWDPAVSGVAALLAFEGANLVARQRAADGTWPTTASTTGSAMTGARASATASDRRGLTLALGESPLSLRRDRAHAEWAGAEEPTWCHTLEALFEWLHAQGNWLYDTRGISNWKRKWRAASERTTYCAVDAWLPWRHVLAVLWLSLPPPGERESRQSRFSTRVPPEGAPL